MIRPTPPFVPSLQMIRRAAAEGYAVPSFCVWNAETIDAVMRAAARARAPVMVMTGPCELEALRPDEMARIAAIFADKYRIPVALHLDHSESRELIEECLAAGYTSVMLDCSLKPFAENAEALRWAVQKARPLGVTVEGELGRVGRVDDATPEGGAEGGRTDPSLARAFVRETGVDLLAVAIGNAHGLYTRPPQLDFGRLEELREAAGVPLVLHGGSGTPEADLRRAIALGIAKVNVASELVRACREALVSQWKDGRNLWVPMALPAALDGISEVVERWLRMTGAAGKA